MTIRIRRPGQYYEKDLTAGDMEILAQMGRSRHKRNPFLYGLHHDRAKERLASKNLIRFHRSNPNLSQMNDDYALTPQGASLLRSHWRKTIRPTLRALKLARARNSR